MSADVLHRSMVMLASCSALVAVSHGKLSKVTSGSGAREREREREGGRHAAIFAQVNLPLFGGTRRRPPELAGSGVCPLGGSTFF